MTRAAWFHCFAGIAGDMTVASLLDAGADPATVNDGLACLGIPGLAITIRATDRCGIAATSVTVEAEEDGHPRSYGDITDLLEKADLPERVVARARSVFGALARVEGALHGIAQRDVHFHEVGGHDALADVVGTCLALESLNIETVYASPVALGRGTVTTAHGTFPNPAPATLRLLEGVPVVGIDLGIELTTPTGAALLSGLDTTFGPLPSMQVEASGYGAGSKDLAHTPNCVQVVVGTLRAAAQGDAREGDGLPLGPGQTLEMLETNLDDTTGEVLAHAVSRLMEAGALDAWVTATTGKKGRPAHTVTALVDPSRAEALARVLVAETGTLGVRRWAVARWAEQRRIEEVDFDGLPVRMKVSGTTAKPEYEDIAAVARATDRPLRDVARRAEELWRSQITARP